MRISLHGAARALLVASTVAACEHRHHDESPAIHHPDVAGRRVVERHVVEPPTEAYDFSLVDQSGSPVRLHDLHGRVAVFSFIYTDCPDACPLLPSYYVKLQDEFSKELADRRLALAFITVDPEKDTPARLKTYTEGMRGRWLFLSGGWDEMVRVWQNYGLHRETKERSSKIVIYHSYRTYIVDAEGKTRFIHVGLWSPKDVIPDIRSLLQGTG